MRWTPLRIRLGLLLGSLLLAALFAEGAARLWLHQVAGPERFARYARHSDLDPDSLRWTPHHYLNYIPTPGYWKNGTAHNRLGYRGPEIVQPKPEGVFRIVTLGGSTTYTVAVADNDKTYPRQMERLLREAYDHPQVEVINAGVVGYNSWETLINFQFRVLDLDPDLVILYQNTNDVHARLVLPETYRGDNGGRRRQWSAPPLSIWDHSNFLRIVRRRMGWSRVEGLGAFVNAESFVGFGADLRGRAIPHTPMAILKANPPVYYRRNVGNLLAIARSHGIPVLLVTWAYSPHFRDYTATEVYRRGFAEHNAILKELSGEWEVPLYDFAAEMPGDTAYWAEGRHVNEAGALRKAELFAGFLVRSGVLEPPRHDGSE